jgi:hypothetical protein
MQSKETVRKAMLAAEKRRYRREDYDARQAKVLRLPAVKAATFGVDAVNAMLRQAAPSGAKG